MHIQITIHILTFCRLLNWMLRDNVGLRNWPNFPSRSIASLANLTLMPTHFQECRETRRTLEKVTEKWNVLLRLPLLLMQISSRNIKETVRYIATLWLLWRRSKFWQGKWEHYHLKMKVMYNTRIQCVEGWRSWLEMVYPNMERNLEKSDLGWGNRKDYFLKIRHFIGSHFRRTKSQYHNYASLKSFEVLSIKNFTPTWGI